MPRALKPGISTQTSGIGTSSSPRIFNPGTLPAKTSRRFRETTPERRRPALPGRPRPSVAAPPPRAIGCRPMESRQPLGRDDGGLIITIIPPHRRQSSRVWPQTDLLPQLLTDRQNTRCCDAGPAALRTPTIHLHATSAVIGPAPPFSARLALPAGADSSLERVDATQSSPRRRSARPHGPQGATERCSERRAVGLHAHARTRGSDLLISATAPFFASDLISSCSSLCRCSCCLCLCPGRLRRDSASMPRTSVPARRHG